MVSFWDTSAIVPLLVQEAATATREAQLQSVPGLIVWWGTRIEGVLLCG